MTRFLTLEEVLTIHAHILATTGGGAGVREPGLLRSCIDQPQMTFDGEELYPTLAEKAAVLGFLLNSNHVFVDGNKRVSYVAMRLFLQMNGWDLTGDKDEKERFILAVAASEMSQDDFVEWVRAHIIALPARPNSSS